MVASCVLVSIRYAFATKNWSTTNRLTRPNEVNESYYSGQKMPEQFGEFTCLAQSSMQHINGPQLTDGMGSVDKTTVDWWERTQPKTKTDFQTHFSVLYPGVTLDKTAPLQWAASRLSITTDFTMNLSPTGDQLSRKLGAPSWSNWQLGNIFQPIFFIVPHSYLEKSQTKSAGRRNSLLCLSLSQSTVFYTLIIDKEQSSESGAPSYCKSAVESQL